MLLPVTGSSGGKMKKTEVKIANITPKMLMGIPNLPRSIVRGCSERAGPAQA